MNDNCENNEKTGKEPQPKPIPMPDKGQKGLPINPRDMTPGRRGTYETR